MERTGDARAIDAGEQRRYQWHATATATATATARGPRSHPARSWLIGLLGMASLVVAAGCDGQPGRVGSAAAGFTATATIAQPSAAAGTPTPTPTALERHYASIARQAIGDLATDVEATYDAGARSVMINTVVGGTVPNSPAEIAAAQERVKAICFRAEQALWSSESGLRQVTITVTGPILDQYAYLIPGAYGAAVLTDATERRLAWGSLTPDTAWASYDNVFLRPDFNDVN